MTVYRDMVAGLNFLVDLLLLLGTNRLAGFPFQWRLVAAAALGGLYSAACLLEGFGFLGNLFWRMVSLGLMSAAAFGWNRSAVTRGGIFLLLSLAMGGAALSIGSDGMPGLILAALGIWALSGAAFGGRVGGREYVNVTLYRGEQEVRIVALRDTGNSLRDPVTGEGVLVISGDVAAKLTGLTPEELAAPLETLGKRPLEGLRLIPYRSVGCGGGMLLAMGMDVSCQGEGRRRRVVAFAPQGLGQGTVYQALTGGV